MIVDFFAFVYKAQGEFTNEQSFIIYTFGFLTSILLASFHSMLCTFVKRTPIILYRGYLLFGYVIISLPVVEIMSKRAYMVGYDSRNYVSNYLDQMNKKTFEGSPLYRIVERVSYFFWKDNYAGAFFLPTLLIIILMCYALGKYNNPKTLPIGLFIFYCSFGLNIGNQTRQMLALSMIVLASTYLLENSKKKFILWVIIATLVHSSALIVMLVLLLDLFDFNKMRTRVAYILVMITSAVIFLRAFGLLSLFIPRHYFYLFNNISTTGVTGMRWIADIGPFVFLTFAIQYKKMHISWKYNSLSLFAVPFRLGGYATYFLMRLYYYPALMFMPYQIDTLLCEEENIRNKRGLVFIILCLFALFYYIDAFIYNSHAVLPYVYNK